MTLDDALDRLRALCKFGQQSGCEASATDVAAIRSVLTEVERLVKASDILLDLIVYHDRHARGWHAAWPKESASNPARADGLWETRQDAVAAVYRKVGLAKAGGN